ncbi:MAG: hypothetical protein KGJ02_02015 [Verrucomicrobiota bacterium]|nr:hypothetical protein [Verrucomicrobiota bacterium]
MLSPTYNVEIIAHLRPHPVDPEKVKSHSISHLPLHTKLSYLPILSTGVGIYRSFLGIVDLIVLLAKAIFGRCSQQANQEALLATGNIFRGVLEIIPFGNVFTFLYDRYKPRYLASHGWDNLVLPNETHGMLVLYRDFERVQTVNLQEGLDLKSDAGAARARDLLKV